MLKLEKPARVQQIQILAHEFKVRAKRMSCAERSPLPQAASLPVLS